MKQNRLACLTDSIRLLPSPKPVFQRVKYSWFALGNYLKTFSESRKTLLISSLLLGAFLLVTPAMTFASSTKYTNSGENATVNVTDNQKLAYFSVKAAGSSSNPLPFMTKSLTGLIQQAYIVQVGGSVEFKDASGVVYYPGYGGGYSVASSCSYSTGCFLYGGSGYGSLGNLLAGMHSTYVFTGTGNNDTIKLTGGLTSDIYSITATGMGDIATVTSGLGSSTYNLVLGPTGTLTISAPASTTSNYYNIVYQTYVT